MTRPTGEQRERWGIVPWALGIIVAALVLVLLIVGRVFLVPLVIALLLFSLASAAIDRLRRLNIGGRAVPNWLTSLLALLLLGLGLAALFAVLSLQINIALASLPVFIEQSQTVIARLFGLLSDDLASALIEAFRDINLNDYVRLAAGSAGSLLVTIVLILLYAGFFLAERPWIEGKIALLFPEPGRRARIMAIAGSMRHNIHRFLVLKTLISGVTALVVWLLALAFGLNFAASIALLTFLLNFIPNIGSILATALPVLVALVQYDSLAMGLAVLGTIGTVQFVLGNILDPMVTGNGLQMSSLAIVISLTFWGAIWGIVGMFLAVPMMVMVLIVCTHVPPLRPVAVLLSKSGELPE
ncbi:AI-2E family transporter [Pseudogemmobacter humi]|uniref:AI-2 transport protein TqsA n=1 Tax=Pseudogemmobacter humi TaxID=2483812 RepID=A0A3P5WF04_9RHOB|nr:AI-2E family transporter [Pseudogemmobacter humi]VDC19863.1 AI-2 transport protein TqsA [Pseudogemmobacter humi]